MPGGKNKVFFDPTDVSADIIGSYSVGKGGDVITSETIGSNEHLHTSAALHAGDGTAITETAGALDVNIASGSISLGSEYAEDSAHTTGDNGMYILGVRQDSLASSVSADGDYGSIKFNAKGEIYVKDTDVLAELAGGISVDDGGGSLTVDAVDLDIRDLAFATDKVDVSGSEVSLDAATLAALETVTVLQGTDPWIIGDGGNSITVDAVDLDIRDLDHASDNVQLGDGTDLITSTLVGSKQSLDVYVANDIDVDDGLCNTAIENTAKSVTSTTGALLASQLADRKYLFVQNRGDQDMFVGKPGVTTADGFEISKRMWMEFRLGASLSLHGVTASSTADARMMEFS